MWEAAYPRAYQPLVEKYGAAAGNPELFLYAIMRKESGFDPHNVSYADARGLLQMIPPTSTQVAAATGEPFFRRPALRSRRSTSAWAPSTSASFTASSAARCS